LASLGILDDHALINRGCFCSARLCINRLRACLRNALFLGDWWLEREKAKHTRRQSKMDALIENALYVTKAHFDTELQAMKEISVQLARVRLIFGEIQELAPSQEGSNTYMAKLSDEMHAADEAFFAKLVEWGVFLTPKLYDAFERCHFAADEEALRLTTRSEDNAEKVRNKEYFFSNYSDACQKVRDRIAHLAVLPGV
jgi:hypothetical protein